MKPYILEFTKSDLDSNLRTGIIDLYSNEQYVNYSVRRSPYGSNLLQNGVYTGAATPISEIGHATPVYAATPDFGGRFVDTSGRIDIVDWQIEVDSPAAMLARPVATLSVFHSPDTVNVPAYGDYANLEWAFVEGVRQDDPLYVIGSNRYAIFELEFDKPIDDVDFVVRFLVEIDPPVLNAYFEGTSRLLNKFPGWMDINEYADNDIESTPSATPTTLGGAFINALAGEWISDIAAKMDYQQAQYYVDSVDLDQKAWIYRSSAVPQSSIKITGDGVDLARSANMQEFYAAEDEDYACFWNREANEIFTVSRYTDLKIDGVSYKQEAYHAWNSIDDIGAAVDLFRLKLETNDNFVKRIKDTFVNRPGSALVSFQTALRRELDMWRLEGATPDSEYVGATPEVLEMKDIERDNDYFDVQGNATVRFKSLADELARKYPVTWGFFLYNKAFWDPDGLGRDGFGFIPKKMDVDNLGKKYIDSGVGDINDAYLLSPNVNEGTSPFSTRLKMKGRQMIPRLEYGPLTFEVAVYPRADMDVYANPTFTGQFTIELTTNEATPRIVYSNFEVSHTSDVSANMATPNSAAFIEWTNNSGTTNVSYTFYDKLTGAIYYTEQGADFTQKLDITNVNKVVIKPGSWNPVSQTYTNVPVSGNYKMWFADTPGVIMGSGGGPSLTDNSFNITTKTGSLYLKSTLTSHSVVADSYVGDKHIYTIKLNDNTPALSPSDVGVTLPAFAYPVGATNKEIVVELMTSWDNAIYGLQAEVDAATPTFLPATYLKVNGSNTWASSRFQVLSAGTTSLMFSSGTGAAYPYQVPTWVPFEAVQTTEYQGLVDINGPHRDGEQLPDRNTNYLAKVYSDLKRSDFGIPDTENYIITWIGIDYINPTESVIAWTPSSLVKPAVTYNGEADEAEYPREAIVETLVSGQYVFSPVTLNARLRPGFNKKWNPRIHSGWVFDSSEEYYIYADPKTFEITNSSFEMYTPNRQGAPISVYGQDGSTPHYDLRQVTNFEMSTPGPLGVPLYQPGYKERVRGTGIANLYAAYENIYDITALDLTEGATPIALDANYSPSNKIGTLAKTNLDSTYELSYRVKKSFYVDNNYVNTNGDIVSRITFDQTPDLVGYDKYYVTVESSTYTPSTPIDLPLNMMYTSVDEGFIYIDHDVHPLERIEVSFSPTRLIANNFDYGQLTVRAYDRYGNPKPNEEIALFTNFGTLDSSTVTTDNDGFASLFLSSEVWDGVWNPSPATPGLAPPDTFNNWLGTILAKSTSSNKTAQIFFGIQIPLTKGNKIFAAPMSDAILSNAQSVASIQGKVTDSEHNAIPSAKVYWRKGRNIYEVLQDIAWNESMATPGLSGKAGYVMADSNGRFVIEPFISAPQPGYWFVAVESQNAEAATPISYTRVGDIVSWYEFPNVNAAVDPITNLALANYQDSTPTSLLPYYMRGVSYPVTVDEQDYEDAYGSATPGWQPPAWYAISKYRQYQMGLMGSSHYDLGTMPSHPDYKEF